jgi:hypothetical protein
MKKMLLFPLAAASAIAFGLGLSQVGCSDGGSAYQVTDTQGQLHTVDVSNKTAQGGAIDIGLRVDGKGFALSYDPAKLRVTVKDTTTGVSMWLGFDKKAQTVTATEDFQYIGAAERSVGLQHLSSPLDLKRTADVLSSGFNSQATNWNLMLPLIQATDDHVLAKLDAKAADQVRQILGFLVSFDNNLPYNPYVPVNDTLASSGSQGDVSWNCPDNQQGICCTQCRCPLSHFFWGTDYSICGGGTACCIPPKTPGCSNCGCGHLDGDGKFVAVTGEGCVTWGMTGCT